MKNLNFRKNGFIFFSVLCVFLIFIVLIIPLIIWSVNEFSWTTHSFKALQALNLADAGAELAIWEIVYNNASFTGWSGVDPKTLTISSFPDNLGKTIGDIYINCLNTSPDNYLITSLGSIPTLGSSSVEKTVKVQVFPHALFNNGIFGNTSVSLTGNTYLDSYNSDVAPYTLETATSNCDVGTNGTITFEENSQVKGDIFVGPSGTVSGDISAHVSGEAYYSGTEVELEDPPFSDYYLNLASQGNLLVNKDNYILPSGDYRFESITVEGKGMFTISDNTSIYIHNDFVVAGQASVVTNLNTEIFIGGNGDFAGQGIVNQTGIPSNLIIYGVSSGANLNFTGQSDFYGAVYAPESSIYLAGEADYYGSLIGNDIELAGNIEFHFDEALLTGGPTVGYDIAYWQED